MKKGLLFVVMVLCVAGPLALAAGMNKPADDKTMKETPAAASTGVAAAEKTKPAETSTGVAVPDEKVTTTEEVVTDETMKKESMPAAKDVEKKKADTTSKEKAY